MEEEIEIVVVGGGIAGLATALALHRKGVKSVVLERSESLRSWGAGIGILANGWRALDQLGIASTLRETAVPLEIARDILFPDDGKEPQIISSPVSLGEARCLKRSDLVETLAHHLPCGTIRFGCQIDFVNLDSSTGYSIHILHDGTRIRAKILIGCDGANSVVADFLGLKPTKLFASAAARGYAIYPEGRGYPLETVRMRKGNTLFGRIPINDKLLLWFLTLKWSPKDSSAATDPKLIQQLSLESMNGLPTEWIEMVKRFDLSTLSYARLRYRAPWDILFGKFRKGTVTVAGDAMHVMGPFLGQGGSAGLEDAVVLARCLSCKRNEHGHLQGKGIEEAIDEYLKERRMRLVWLSTQTYLTGLLIETPSVVLKVIIGALLAILFPNRLCHTTYDCGRL